MCDRKYMFGDKSTFGSSQNSQNIPKKCQQDFFLYIKQGLITHSFTFYIPFENLQIFLGNQGMKHILFTICTLYNLKKLKRFLNITRNISYKKLPYNQLIICYVYNIYNSIRQLVICKYRDSNMLGNHFRILNERMVQSVKSVWTVL